MAKTCEIYDYILNYLHTRFIGMGLICPKPAGSFYLLPDLENFRKQLYERAIITSIALVDALLAESNIALLPGSDFYMPATSLGFRVAAVDFDGVRMLETLPRAHHVIEEYFRMFFPKVEQGCECIKRFLTE